MVFAGKGERVGSSLMIKVFLSVAFEFIVMRMIFFSSRWMSQGRLFTMRERVCVESQKLHERRSGVFFYIFREGNPSGNRIMALVVFLVNVTHRIMGWDRGLWSGIGAGGGGGGEV